MLGLTAKQLGFCNALLDGSTVIAAYTSNYNNKGKKDYLRQHATKVHHNPNVQAYLKAQREKLAAKSQVTRVHKLAALSKMILDEKAPTLHRIKAIEVHNVMTGDNAPEQVNVFGLSDLLALVRKS